VIRAVRRPAHAEPDAVLDFSAIHGGRPHRRTVRLQMLLYDFRSRARRFSGRLRHCGPETERQQTSEAPARRHDPT